jgi:hypothetical protein
VDASNQLTEALKGLLLDSSWAGDWIPRSFANRSKSKLESTDKD